MAISQPSFGAETEPTGSAGPEPLDWDVELQRRGRLRLRTLLGLRWLAVAGQTAAVLMVALVFGFDIKLGWCLGVIAASAWLNVFLSVVSPGQRLARNWEAAAQLAFDTAQLGVLLALTGGVANPFCLLLLAPVTVAAATLPTRQVLGVALVGFVVVTLLLFFKAPLPWFPGRTLELPRLYETGMWAALVTGMGFTAGYAWTAAAEASRMELALAATQRVLAREQQLAALGGLAAAAAHELGTPLATIQVVAKELLRSSPADDPVAEDARLLLQQAERCRDILRTLAQKPEAGDVVYARLGLAQLLDEVVEPYREMGPTIVTEIKGPPGEFVPDVRRLPEVIHALASFVENAADFATSVVGVTGRFDEESIWVEVRDDGPGFSPDVLVKLGEPYVTSRPHGEGSRSHHHGMGLGFFIAKTLLERSGAKVTFGNDRDGGAVVEARWPRARLEAEPAL
ncbi:ActS/PrrB/RegB family redox-sensitive histidine kinase [Caulobacter sp. 17J65-9]|uniref:ActS/PrrB/RegB family redox-sensitive histidine kinase n=1 Tax=Caulobacter sp. 17J65-9 TaxID=2709382 RepID=UPI0013CB7627|nr:ActS/PrrB/RegB family redox-sensitive histidine kinase [Caulobacter sp. 17J65-9]NEX93082.1 ActS/PrrB/RegB family redox-sensitive histidine kinase [Caulobacter sp. 17J65-9]